MWTPDTLLTTPSSAPSTCIHMWYAYTTYSPQRLQSHPNESQCRPGPMYTAYCTPTHPPPHTHPHPNTSNESLRGSGPLYTACMCVCMCVCMYDVCMGTYACLVALTFSVPPRTPLFRYQESHTHTHIFILIKKDANESRGEASHDSHLHGIYIYSTYCIYSGDNHTYAQTSIQ